MNIRLGRIITWVSKPLLSNELIEVSFLIPINEDKYSGNGRPHDASRWHDFNHRLITGFKGYTKCPIVSGAYVNKAGDVIYDELVEYRLAVKKSDIQKVRILLADAASLFGQECIYFKNGDTAEFLYR